MKWIEKSFDALTLEELYELLKERVLVFVVEQECPYPEIDDYDQKAIHLFLRNDEDALIAYCRILPGGTKYEEVSIGRVLVTKDYRHKGIAHQLMDKAINTVYERWGNVPIKLQAQSHLKHFYGHHGFEAVSNEYMDDGIPHVDMIKK